MARKRTKPTAEHIEAASPEAPPVENQVPPVVPETPETETSEPAKHAEQVQPRRMHGDPKNGQTRAQAQPNPFGEHTITLSDEKDGPRMRLFRERTNFGPMAAIQFPERPDDAIRQKLHEGGFSWKAADRVWKKPLGQEHPGVEQRKAHELFVQIANELRVANGCEPITGLGHGMA